MTQPTSCSLITAGLLLSAFPAISSCGEEPRSAVARACVKISEYGTGPGGVAQSARCTCADRAARRYLDAPNYAALESAANVVVADDRPGALRELLAVPQSSGMPSALAAAAAAGDFLMLLHKVTSQCQGTAELLPEQSSLLRA